MARLAQRRRRLEMTETHAKGTGGHDPATLAETRTTPTLISDLIGHITELFRKEMMLFRAEMNEKVNQVTSAGVMLAGALVLGIVGLIFLAGTVMLGIIALGLSQVLAALIVGGLLSAIALIMALSGKKKLNPSNLAPNRTVQSVSRDARMAREKA